MTNACEIWKHMFEQTCLPQYSHRTIPFLHQTLPARPGHQKAQSRLRRRSHLLASADFQLLVLNLEALGPLLFLHLRRHIMNNDLMLHVHYSKNMLTLQLRKGSKECNVLLNRCMINLDHSHSMPKTHVHNNKDLHKHLLLQLTNNIKDSTQT